MSLVIWPFKRKTYGLTGEPISVGDIKAANEAVLDGLSSLFQDVGAYQALIISGFEYFGLSYSGGILYFNGAFYKCDAGLNENEYLVPAPTDTELKLFSDAVSRNIYTISYAVASASSTDSIVQFIGTMDAYRVGNYQLRTELLQTESDLTDLSADVLHISGITRNIKPAALDDLGSVDYLGNSNAPLTVDFAAGLGDTIFHTDQFRRVRVQGNMQYVGLSRALPKTICTFATNYRPSLPSLCDVLYFRGWNITSRNEIMISLTKATGVLSVFIGVMNAEDYIFLDFNYISNL